MAIKKVLHVSWGFGKYKTYTKEFKDEQHEQNWRKAMAKRGGVVHDEEIIN